MSQLHVLSVCTGNICRSPLASLALRRAAPGVRAESAGLHALVGHGMDPEALDAAQAFGLEPAPHSARQFDARLGTQADIILVMERRQRNHILRHWPEFGGKTFLMRDGPEAGDIPDPYRAGRALHLRAAELIVESADTWSRKLRVLQR